MKPCLQTSNLHNRLQVLNTLTNPITCNRPIHSPISFQVTDGEKLCLEVVKVENDDDEEGGRGQQVHEEVLCAVLLEAYVPHAAFRFMVVDNDDDGDVRYP